MVAEVKRNRMIAAPRFDAQVDDSSAMCSDVESWGRVFTNRKTDPPRGIPNRIAMRYGSIADSAPDRRLGSMSRKIGSGQGSFFFFLCLAETIR